MDSNQHIDNVLSNIRTIYVKASERIDALKPGEKIPATKLAEDLAAELAMSGAQLYPTLKFLFDGYPGVDIRKGAHGGIIKLPIPSAASTVVAPAETAVTDKE